MPDRGRLKDAEFMTICSTEPGILLCASGAGRGVHGPDKRRRARMQGLAGRPETRSSDR